MHPILPLPARPVVPVGPKGHFPSGPHQAPSLLPLEGAAASPGFPCKAADFQGCGSLLPCFACQVSSQTEAFQRLNLLRRCETLRFPVTPCDSEQRGSRMLSTTTHPAWSAASDGGGSAVPDSLPARMRPGWDQAPGHARAQAILRTERDLEITVLKGIWFVFACMHAHTHAQLFPLKTYFMQQISR